MILRACNIIPRAARLRPTQPAAAPGRAWPLTRRKFIASCGMGCAALAGIDAAGPADAPGRWRILGFSKPFQDLSIEETAETVAEIGWDGIECPVRPQGQIEPERAADELPRLVEALKRRGKEVGLLTTAIISARQPHAESLLRLAARLGIRRYRLGFFRYDLKRPIPDQLKEIGAALRDLEALNLELGLQAGFQNHSGGDYVGAPVWDIWTMIRELDPQRMGICFDIGHATVEGGTSWPIEARLAQGRFTAVFVKDFIWQRTDKGWQPKWVTLGEGMLDRSFFAWLKTTGFNGPFSQHHEYDHGRGKPMITRMQQDLKVLKEWLT